MKLKYKITISMTLISLGLLVLTSYIYSQISYKSIMEHEEEQLILTVKEASESIQSELKAELSNVKTMASAPIVVKYLKESNLQYKVSQGENLNEYIAELNKKWMNADDEEDAFVKPYIHNPLAKFLKKQQSIFNDVYGEIFITNTHGVIIATTGKLTTLAHAHKYWWKASFAEGEGKVFFDDRGFDTSVNDYVIGIVLPIKENGKIIGILKANVKILSTLSKIVLSVNRLNRGTLKIVRTKGSVIYEESLPPLSTSVNPTLLINLKNRDIGSKTIKYFGRECLTAFSPISVSLDDENIIFGGKATTKDSLKGNDGEIWHTVITYDKELALQESKDTNLIIIYIGLVFTLVTWILAYYIGRWISKPIEELQVAQDELQKQEEIMVAQSRHAAMGEMISMIAHQWRQPISVIAMNASNILADIELEILQEKSLKNTSEDIIKQTQELSKTIDDFKNFFKPETEVQEVFVKELFDDALGVIGKSLQNAQIEFTLELDENKKITTFSREMMQVLINIIKNAKEALIESSIENKKITVYCSEDGDKFKIRICDNAGGVDETNIEDIFNPYFTTKGEKNGTGLGLYMSKTIIEKHLEGSLNVENNSEGACFEIKISHVVKEK